MNSSSSTPYSSIILNDLHTHFPRLLYRPHEFQTVQDVLQYIVHVASESPYSRAQTTYQASSPASSSSLSYSSLFSSLPSSVPSVRQRTVGPSVARIPVRIIPTTYVRTTRVPSDSSSAFSASSSSSSASSFINTFADHFVSDLLSTMLTGNQTDVNNHLYTQILQESLQSFEPPVLSASQEDLQTYTTLVHEPPESENICSICQDSYDTQSECRILNACQHRFHRQCIDTWFQTHITCPVCRHDIRNPHE